MSKIQETKKTIQTEESVRFAEDLSAVMRTQEGRRIMISILSLTGLYEPAPASADIERYIGRRDFGLHLRRNMMIICPSEFQKGLAEEYERKKHNDARLREAAVQDAKEKDVM